MKRIDNTVFRELGKKPPHNSTGFLDENTVQNMQINGNSGPKQTTRTEIKKVIEIPKKLFNIFK